MGLLAEFLRNEAACQLPCWGGLQPGKSTENNVREHILNLGSISESKGLVLVDSTWIAGKLNIKFFEKDTEIILQLGYIISQNKDVLESIVIDTYSVVPGANGLIYGDENYKKWFSEYTLGEVFAKYGIPKQIFIKADIGLAEPTAPNYFEIRVTYPSQGVFINYTIPAEISKDMYVFCPSNSIIKLDLIAENQNNSYEEFFQLTSNSEWVDFPNSPYYKSVNESLGITDEEFYSIYQSSQDHCLQSPIEIWSEP